MGTNTEPIGRQMSTISSPPTSTSSSPFRPVSSSSSSHPFSIAPAPPPPITTSSKHSSMEEVWKDICLSNCGSTTATNRQQFHHPTAIRGMLFHEILPRSLRPEQGRDDPGAILSLSSLRTPREYASCGFKLLPVSTSTYYPPQEKVDVLMDSSVTTVEFPILPKKRAADDESSAAAHGHKNRRMMKNRESAARSRARKQAYTNELEDKVARLMEENARLRREQERTRLAAPSQFPKKHMLSRTLTAPF